jgi:hypothetical protein
MDAQTRTCSECGYVRPDPADGNARVIYPSGICEDCARERDGESDAHDYPDDD